VCKYTIFFTNSRLPDILVMFLFLLVSGCIRHLHRSRNPVMLEVRILCAWNHFLTMQATKTPHRVVLWVKIL